MPPSSDERPTIPGTGEWPDVPVARAIIGVNAVKQMHGGEGEDLDVEGAACEYVRLVLTACGESGIEPDDVLQMGATASDNLIQAAVGRAMRARKSIDLGVVARSVWLDGFLHGVAAARRLWADPDTGVVELRPEEE